MGSTGAAIAITTGNWVTLAGCLILVFAWAKARIILADYLGLAQAPFWRRGFNLVLGLFILVALGLFLIPML
ncbi:MAG: hypothetical protein KUG74_01320 [Rhodobacteraceae bacterium]|nr:hypothetical protein [Paracoccaceae bacterium]